MAIVRVPVELSWSGSGGPGVNVFHIRSSPTGGILPPGSPLEILHAFYAALGVSGEGTQGFMAPGWRANVGEMVDVATGEVVSPLNPDGTNQFPEVVGRSSDSALPPSQQVCISWKTAQSGRRARGRTFVGPLSLRALEGNGTPSDECLSAFRAAAADLVSDSAADLNGAIVVYGRQAVGSEARVGRDVTGFTVRNQFAVLRSRRD